MSRVQLELPAAFAFTCEISVRVSDLNYGGHVGNDSILSLMHEARIQFYRQLGFNSELNFEGAVGQVIADAVIVYKSESFLGDDLSIKIAVNDFNKYGFDMYYLIENKKTNNEVARGKTNIVCYDYDKRKVASIPTILLEKLKSA
jgi:acyl-CoA thioester hydrolase